ncbi:MAG: hypothetical protein H7Z74_00725 [Anaerolineae bacterium]|nr:hypothetical protein [Gemmatimonadaceae bacterium]
MTSSSSNGPLGYVATGVGRMMTLIVNLYTIKSDDHSWTLIDTGIPMQGRQQ